MTKSATLAPNSGAGTAPLENYANNLSASEREQASDLRVSNRETRYLRRSELWHLSGMARVRKCGRVMTASHVTVRRSGKVTGLAGLATCGSVWACPVCNAKVMSRRALEIGAAVALWQAHKGRVAFVTLTMRHNRGHSLQALWDALAAAWQAVIGSRKWGRDVDRYGVEGWLRVVEVTQGRNGWHVHVHALVFMREGASSFELAALHRSMFDRWRGQLVRKGFDAPTMAGQDARLISGPGDVALAGYFTKATDNAVRVGLEFTQTQTKTTRTAFSTAPVWSLLDGLLNTGEVEYLNDWREWERGSKGRRQLTWSQGLRCRLGLLEEVTDEEIAAEVLGDDRDNLVAITAEGWATLVRSPVLIPRMLSVTDVGGFAALQGFLITHDIDHEVLSA